MKGARGKRIALFMSFGGFDQDRYLCSVIRKVANRGAIVVATLAIKRSCIQEKTCEAELVSFCAQALEALSRRPAPAGENTHLRG
jgi:hypothetical protein